MTIKKRLFWSNLYMILIPVIVTSIVGVICIAFMWLALIHGVGFGIHDQEEFDLACEVLSEDVEKKIGTSKDFQSIESILDSNKMTVQLYADSEKFYSYGEEKSQDAALKKSLDLLEENATISQNGRAMYVQHLTKNGVAYQIYFAGSFASVRTYANMKTGIIFAAIAIIITIISSVLVTNRFLVRFVWKRIEESLDILTNGVHKLKFGELDYRIQYDRDDEFSSVCDDFNEMAEQLRLSIEKIQKQEQSRKELIAGISHDIRSPLTSIQAYVEGLIDGVARTPEKQQFYLQTIKQKAEDLSHLVSQLFLYSKMELGEYVEHPTKLMLNELVQTTVDQLREEYQAKGLEITTKLEPVAITADSIQLQRIITNIISNSLKYKEKEMGHLQIELTANQKEAKNCVLTFIDDGPGVPAEALAHLFEVFYRSDPARQNPNRGSGLGLAIVKNAVEHMGGSVEAFLPENEGLEIQIMFPINTSVT